MTKAEFNALYNLFETVATAIDKCHLRKPPTKKALGEIPESLIKMEFYEDE